MTKDGAARVLLRKIDKRDTKASSRSRLRWKCGLPGYLIEAQGNGSMSRFRKGVARKRRMRKTRQVEEDRIRLIQFLHMRVSQGRVKACSQGGNNGDSFKNHEVAEASF